jgi:GT2 family glycosyltransferase
MQSLEPRLEALSRGDEAPRECVLPVTVILCTRNRRQMLLESIATILGGSRVPAELIVMDQSDQEDLLLSRTAAANHSGIRYFWTDVRGLSHANNRAAADATNEILVFTHDDIRADGRWLRELVRPVFSEGRRTVATGRVVPTAPEIPGGFAPTLSRSAKPAVYEGRLHFDVIKPLNMAIHRSALLEVGGFDEDLGPGTPFPGAEDADLGHRLLEAGFRIVYVPDAVIHHRAWRPAQDYLPLRWNYGVAQGAFYAKHFRVNDRHMLWRMRRNASRRLRRFPFRLWREGSRAFGDPLFLAGNLVGAVRWWRSRRARATQRSNKQSDE